MTTIDLSRLAAPDAIEALDFETLFAAFKARFQTSWDAKRAADPTLPAYDVGALETDPVVIVGEAWSYLRLLDRARVNDGIRSVLAPLARGTNLDNVVARLGVERLIVTPATDTASAVMESDARLLMRYLLAFSRPSAGSAEGYLYAAYTAWPGLLHAAVNGRAVHGRRGDVDLVLAGPGGRDATNGEMTLVRDAAQLIKPEAHGLTVMRATRRTYEVAGTVSVAAGPDAETVRAEAQSRITEAATDRLRIGAEVPVALLEGAAYGLSIIRADLSSPSADIPADRYTIPVMASIALQVTQ
ncbi:baseplate assembly protein [Kaistia algarum]|uniref:baseplate assembly protein n=1 Tax=Kaistia algarum TaxID=2083279 RepID=UPI000CE84A2E|nr:baseplate J/gp47 family protein [Kaistia algarum]MCX5512282.1 baseplate J/gp47 family protein [Kaistia algarum]PPE80373.1 baseplate assembly protein [Kaistia algarum]